MAKQKAKKKNKPVKKKAKQKNKYVELGKMLSELDKKIEMLRKVDEKKINKEALDKNYKWVNGLLKKTLFW